jgi:hypothetical protein
MLSPRRKIVDAVSKDKDGRTPLLWAARNEHEATLRLLVSRTEMAIGRVGFDGGGQYWFAVPCESGVAGCGGMVRVKTMFVDVCTLVEYDIIFVSCRRAGN